MAGQALAGIFQPIAVERQKVIQRQAGAQLQPFGQPGIVERQQEGQRAHQVRRNPHQMAPLAQGFAHQAEFHIAQIAKPAMGQLGIVGTGGAGEVARFHQSDLQPAQGAITRGETAGGAAADDQDVEEFAGEPGKGALHARKASVSDQISELLT